MSKADSVKEAKAIIKEKQKEDDRKKKEDSGVAEIAGEIKPTEAEKKAAKEVKKTAEKEEKAEEKIYTFSLKDAWRAPKNERARSAAKVLKAQLKRHTKREVKLDESMNAVLWQRGIKHPPRKVKVKVRITKDKATAYPSK